MILLHDDLAHHISWNSSSICQCNCMHSEALWKVWPYTVYQQFWNAKGNPSNTLLFHETVGWVAFWDRCRFLWTCSIESSSWSCNFRRGRDGATCEDTLDDHLWSCRSDSMVKNWLNTSIRQSLSKFDHLRLVLEIHQFHADLHTFYPRGCYRFWFFYNMYWKHLAAYQSLSRTFPPPQLTSSLLVS